MEWLLYQEVLRSRHETVLSQGLLDVDNNGASRGWLLKAQDVGMKRCYLMAWNEDGSMTGLRARHETVLSQGLLDFESNDARQGWPLKAQDVGMKQCYLMAWNEDGWSMTTWELGMPVLSHDWRPESKAWNGAVPRLWNRHETVQGRIRPIGLKKRHDTVLSHGLCRHEKGVWKASTLTRELGIKWSHGLSRQERTVHGRGHPISQSTRHERCWLMTQ